MTTVYLRIKIEGGSDVKTSFRNGKVFDPAWTDPVGPNPAAKKSILQAD